ncbi:MAG: FAD-dependent oxidoreductase [Gemmatimonas sp.]
MLTRRQMVLSLASAALMRRAWAQTAAQVDVAIVGAGAAGIAAARALSAAGLSYVVLEARDRVGGRTWTVDGLGQPFDMGAHWLHIAQRNPLVSLAQGLGLDLSPSEPESGQLFEAGSPRVEADHDAYHRAISQMKRRGILPSLFGPDRPLSRLAPNPDRWGAVALTLPSIEMAEEPERVSLHDYLSLGSGRDLQVSGGYGELVKSLARGLNIRLSTPVSDIRWQTSDGVALSGAFGTLTARAVIVTLPTSLLAANTIRFFPELPDELRQAVADLPMGVFEKVGFQLVRSRPDLPEYAIATGPVAQGLTHGLHFSPDRSVATVMLTGDTARNLLAAGTRARIEVARGLLADVVGSADISTAVLTTDWLGDPLARGAYTHSKVGAMKARQRYATPLADRLWFAGEAARGEHAVTVAGAWISGTKAAAEIARVLRR